MKNFDKQANLMTFPNLKEPELSGIGAHEGKEF